MKEFSYKLNLKLSIKIICVSILGELIFVDMRNGFLEVHRNNYLGLSLIYIGMVVMGVFILGGCLSILGIILSYNNRVVLREEGLKLPGFLRLFKEIEVKYSEIKEVENLVNLRKEKILEIHTVQGKKHELLSSLFSSMEKFDEFSELLELKVQSKE